MNGVEKNDRYWGDMVKLNKEIDAVTKTMKRYYSSSKTVKANLEMMNNIIAVAQKVLDGIDGLLSERGDIAKYGKVSTIIKAKKIFDIKSKTT